jgi:hypothetical protein
VAILAANTCALNATWQLWRRTIPSSILYRQLRNEGYPAGRIN